MAIPVARRVIFSTHVVPTQSIEGEEESVRHTEFQSSPNGTLGGKGIASIDKEQWGDGWVSFAHQNAYWEDQSDVWELQGETWDGTLALGTSGVQLTADATDCGFLYVKNTGSAKNALVSLNGDSHYYIVIPPNGSVCLRGTTDLECSEVYVKASHSDGTTIEWIIAQLTP